MRRGVNYVGGEKAKTLGEIIRNRGPWGV